MSAGSWYDQAEQAAEMYDDGPAHAPMDCCGECTCGAQLVESVAGEVCPVEYHERMQALRAEQDCEQR